MAMGNRSMGKTMSPVIFHIDVNSAYLSWTAVEQLKNGAEVDLREIPAIIGGDKKSRHGVVLAKSISAKKYGIRTGEPVVNAFRKCPNLVMEPPNHKMYREKSEKLMEYLRGFTSKIEQVSVDECYLDFTEIGDRFPSPLDAAFLMKNGIRERFGFTVNIGISENKLLAKMASDFQKPDMCHTLWEHEIPKKLWPLPVRDLFFVGGSAEKKMQSLGIRTIYDLAHCDLKVLRSHLGVKYADQIHLYANGIDNEPVAEKEPINKGYGNSTTLSHDVDDYDTAFQVLLSLCETVGTRLRRDHVMCGCICVELKDWNFHSHSHQAMLDAPTDSSTVLYENACKLLIPQSVSTVP